MSPSLDASGDYRDPKTIVVSGSRRDAVHSFELISEYREAFPPCTPRSTPLSLVCITPNINPHYQAPTVSRLLVVFRAVCALCSLHTPPVSIPCINTYPLFDDTSCTSALRPGIPAQHAICDASETHNPRPLRP